MSGETLTEAELDLLEAAMAEQYVPWKPEPLLTAVEQIMAAARADERERIITSAQVELDAARAQVAAVEAALVDPMTWAEPYGHGPLVYAADLRAALDQPGQAVARIKAEALREAADALTEGVGPNFGMRHDGTEDPQASAYVEGLHDPWSTLRNRADAIESEAGQ